MKYDPESVTKEIRKKLEKFRREKVFILLLLWVPAFQLGYFTNLKYLIQLMPPAFLCYPNYCQLNQTVDYFSTEMKETVFVSKTFRPKVSLFGENLVRVLPDICSARKPGISQSGLCMWNKTEENVTICSRKNKFYFQSDFFSDSVITEFRMVCHRRYLFNSMWAMQYFGKALGHLLGGFLCNKLGRRPTILGFSLAAIICNVLGMTIPAIEAYVIFSTLTELSLTGAAVGGLIYSLEMVWSNTRFVKLYWVSHVGVVGYFYNIPQALGGFSSTVIRMVLRNLPWRNVGLYLTLVTVWQLPILYFFLPESLSWLLTMKRTKEANSVLQSLIGDYKNSTEFLKRLQRQKQENSQGVAPAPAPTNIHPDIDVENIEKENENVAFLPHPGTMPRQEDDDDYSDLENLVNTYPLHCCKPLISQNLLKYTLIFVLLRSVLAMVYHFFNFASELLYKNWSGIFHSIYDFRLFAFWLEILMGLILPLAEGKLGRRRLIAYLLFMSGMSLILCSLEGIDLPGCVTAFFLLARTSVPGVISILYIYHAMLYPPSIRTMAFAWLGFLGYVAVGLIQFFYNSIFKSMYEFFFGLILVCFFGMKLSIFLPESINNPLPQTEEEIVFNAFKNTSGSCCVSYTQYVSREPSGQADPYPDELHWAKGLTEEVRKARTTKFGVTL